MLLQVHSSPGVGNIVAVCDRELLNTTISNGNLSVKISEAFYGNCPASEEMVRDALKRAGNINLMGKRSVSIAIDMGLITLSGCIMTVSYTHLRAHETDSYLVCRL